MRLRASVTRRSWIDALRPLTDLPLIAGVGIATPEQAIEACAFADGAIVGSALMARLVDGDRAGAVDLAAEFADAIHEIGAGRGIREPVRDRGAAVRLTVEFDRPARGRRTPVVASVHWVRFSEVITL